MLQTFSGPLGPYDFGWGGDALEAQVSAQIGFLPCDLGVFPNHFDAIRLAFISGYITRSEMSRVTKRFMHRLVQHMNLQEKESYGRT